MKPAKFDRIARASFDKTPLVKVARALKVDARTLYNWRHGRQPIPHTAAMAMILLRDEPEAFEAISAQAAQDD